MAQVLTGIDVLRRDDYAPLREKRVGLLTNPSGVTRDLIPTYRLLHQADNVQLVALFGPEHGVMGLAAEGEKVASGRDPATGLPVYSLYGDAVRPTEAMLDGLDLLICDLQDIGARYYTYLWTVTHVLETCGAIGLPVLVLDRPNPLGGEIVAGCGLEPELASFVGRFDLPIQHGMTLGELAQLLNVTGNPTPAELAVVACEGYTRSMRWEETGLPFVPPSPNIPNLLTARHYPGACLIEGTILSEGRGTALPFQIVGAPFINADHLADALNALGSAGCRFRPHRFQPTRSKFAEQVCGGVHVHITDAQSYEPIATWLHVIATIRTQYPDEFQWTQFFDKLIGSEQPRRLLKAGADVATVMADWAGYGADFRERRTPYLLYD